MKTIEKRSIYLGLKYRHMSLSEIRALKYLKNKYPGCFVKFYRSQTPDFIVFSFGKPIGYFEVKRSRKESITFSSKKQLEKLKTLEPCFILIYPMVHIPSSIIPKEIITTSDLKKRKYCFQKK